MKKIGLFIVSLVVFSSCSSGDGGSEDPSPTPVENSSPTVPSLNYPTNNLVCISNTINFQWNTSTDAQNDAITYQLQVATDNAFIQNLNSSNATALSKQLTLNKGKLYYWRINATDSKNASSNYSPTYSFYTEGEEMLNHLPFAPVVVAPALNAFQTNGAINLSWTAVDADATDILTYDVYFGTVNPPTNKVASAITSKNFSVNTSTASNYYWKVVVKDGKGGETLGQTWNFKTN